MEQKTILHFKSVRCIIELGKFLLTLIDELFKRGDNSRALFFATIDSLDLSKDQKIILKNTYLQSEPINIFEKNLIRKKVLDFGNELVRSLDKDFEKFNVFIKQ